MNVMVSVKLTDLWRVVYRQANLRFQEINDNLEKTQNSISEHKVSTLKLLTTHRNWLVIKIFTLIVHTLLQLL